MTSSEREVAEAREALWRGIRWIALPDTLRRNPNFEKAVARFEAAVRRDALTAVRDSDQAAADFGRNER